MPSQQVRDRTPKSTHFETIHYFLIPYRELNLPGALYGPGLCVLVATGALTLGCGATTFWRGRDGATAR